MLERDKTFVGVLVSEAVAARILERARRSGYALPLVIMNDLCGEPELASSEPEPVLDVESFVKTFGSALGEQSVHEHIVGKLVVDRQTWRAAYDGAPLRLEAREFRLLEILASHAGRVVTSEQLLGHLWDERKPAKREMVSVYVCKLRRKLRAVCRVPLIRTVPRIGYMLETP